MEPYPQEPPVDGKPEAAVILDDERPLIVPDRNLEKGRNAAHGTGCAGLNPARLVSLIARFRRDA